MKTRSSLSGIFFVPGQSRGLEGVALPPRIFVCIGFVMQAWGGDVLSCWNFSLSAGVGEVSPC